MTSHAAFVATLTAHALVACRRVDLTKHECLTTIEPKDRH
jgi:hypothetical protein